MKVINFLLNNSLIETEASPVLPLVEFIREEMNLKGTKIGCREGDCGACQVLIGELVDGRVIYKNVPSCLTPLGKVSGKHVVTIEGLNMDKLNALQQIVVDDGLPQCGFCIPGFIISLTAFCLGDKPFDFPNAMEYTSGNICRCTGYDSLRNAERELVKRLADVTPGEHLQWLCENNFLPSYFLTVAENLEKIRQNDNFHFSGKKILAGGSDLMLNPQQFEEVEFLHTDKSLSGITMADELLIIKAGTTVEEIKNNEIIAKYLKELPSLLQFFASKSVRNLATIGGNIANASPIADLTIALLALDSVLVLTGNNTRRRLKLKDFYLDYKKTDLHHGEIIEQIEIKIIKFSRLVNFTKIAKREHMDIASVNSAASFVYKDDKIVHATISAGGIAPVPLLLKKSSTFLQGKEVTSDIVRQAALIAIDEISPIADMRGSVEYKSLLLRQLIYSHFIELFPSKITLGDL